MGDKKGKPYLEGRKILAVDDFEKWLNVVKGNAEYYGAKEKDIFLAKDIREGKRIYSLEEPNIVVSDINFGADDSANRDGLELLSFIHQDYFQRKGRFWSSYLRLVAMSSLNPEIEKATRFAGADYFINKKVFTKDWDSCVKQMDKYWHFLGRVGEAHREEYSPGNPWEEPMR